MPFKEAREYIRSLKLKSRREWDRYRKSSKLPYDIPKNPGRVYKTKWEGLDDWLGTTLENIKFRLSCQNEFSIAGHGIENGSPPSSVHPGGLVIDFITSVPSGQPAMPLKLVLAGRLSPVGNDSCASTAPVLAFSL